ncbi:hypothetical protein BU15DRAFT_60782 [Melanogaster broomeanus]|nr:hypothetical protein BU15DRAFT_60782 [Melanogaster broomeanus]
MDETHLVLMDNVLARFHAHKHAIMTAEARRGKSSPITHWQILKLELMQSVPSNIRKKSVDPTEHAYIIVIKDLVKNTNNNCYDAQICCHLDHAEKCRHFETTTSLRLMEEASISGSEFHHENDDSLDVAEGACQVKNYFIAACLLLQGQPGDVHPPPRTLIADNTAIHLNHDPSINHLLIDQAAEMFHIPDLHNALAEYLHHAHFNPDTYHPIGGQRKVRES